MIQKSDLKHGDVVLYEHRTHQSLLARCIRLITGSKYTHAGIILMINGSPVIFEQLGRRIYRFVELYNVDLGEHAYIYRPKFKVPGTDRSLFKYKTYGYLKLVDCLINHFFSLFYFQHEYKPYLGKYAKTKICSQLVADCLDLKNKVDWCKYHEVVEPDDYANHDENFLFMGQLL